MGNSKETKRRNQRVKIPRHLENKRKISQKPFNPWHSPPGALDQWLMQQALEKGGVISATVNPVTGRVRAKIQKIG